MKRFALLFMVSMFVCCCYAQNLHFGIRGGLNISTESDREYPGITVSTAKFKPGVNIGGVINYSITENIDVELDVLYSTQGFKEDVYITVTDTPDDTKKTCTVTSHYINVPVVAKYFVVNGLYLEFGPQIGFLLSKKDNLEINNTDIYESSKTKKVDFGLAAGLGYEFTNRIFLNARYSHGFVGTSKIYDGGKNRNIQISLGYLF